MKKLIITAFGILLFASCSKEETSTEENPITPNPTVTSKIYFDAFNDNIGTAGIKWSEIYSINTDGTGQQQITNYSINGTVSRIAEEPIVNSDGTKIYFSSNKDNSNGEIFKMNVDGTSLLRITDNSGNNFTSPKIFQNGTKLLLEKEGYVAPDKFGEIYSANIDGTNQIKLTNYPTEGNCHNAIVNPSNTLIAYACKINSVDYQIYTMSLNGTNKQILTTNNTLSKTNPKYSNDGTKIVFQGRVATNVNKHSEIFIMNSNGTNIVQLTNYSINGTLNYATREPIFSNNGTQIYYVSDESGISQIYKMNIDGSGKTKITTSPEDKSNPFLK